MLIKAITYEDFNGEKKTKNFYFHLSKFEITKMQFQEDGGIRNYLKKMIGMLIQKNLQKKQMK